MKYLILTMFGLSSYFSSFAQEKPLENTTYYLIRHAEKDRSNTLDKNPHLTNIGKTRAIKWSEVLQHISFDAVYSTNYYRTKETGWPTAEKNSLDIIIYNENNINILKFLEETQGKTVLVVGHSDTIPRFVNTILNKDTYQDIEDSNNGNLYIITVLDGKKLDQVLTIN